MENQFRLEVREDHPAAVMLDLIGDLSQDAQEPMLKFLSGWEARADQARAGFIVLNFTQVPYINSLGIALLIRFVRATRKNGQQTFAYGITSHYQKLFLMVGLTEYMMIYPDEYSITQRIASLGSP